jgi:bifunctional DNA-binding transcriptional regulator/antitoxin component of YhaV-PrlF toxin-antitoxin module
MEQATLGPNAEIVVPPETRRALGVGPGDTILFDIVGDRVVVRKAEKSGLDLLAELASPMWRGYADEVQRERDEWNQ